MKRGRLTRRHCRRRMEAREYWVSEINDVEITGRKKRREADRLENEES